MKYEKKFITTNDGVKLELIDVGEGPVIVMIPGGVGGPPEMYEPLIENLRKDHRVVSVGSRGTGLSDRATWGFHVARHSRDIYDAIVALDLCDVSLFGYSGGQDIVLSYYELFRNERLSRLILGDNPPANQFFTDWPKEKILNSGKYATPEEWYEFCNMMGAAAAAPSEMGESDEPCDGELLKEMCVSHGGQDWMNLLHTIDIPTLVIRASESNNGTERGARWMQHEIKGSRLSIISGDHGTAMLGSELAECIRDFVASSDNTFAEDRANALKDTSPYTEPFDENEEIRSCARADLDLIAELYASGALSTDMVENINAMQEAAERIG